MSGEERGITGARAAALRETAVVLALGLAAIWLIPAQTTSGSVLGLSPAFLPTLCAVAIIALTVVGLALRLWRPEPLRPERLAAVWPAAMVACVAIAGVLMLQFAGRFFCGLAIMVLGLGVLGERRFPVVLITLAGTCLVLGGVFRGWR